MRVRIACGRVEGSNLPHRPNRSFPFSIFQKYRQNKKERELAAAADRDAMAEPNENRTTAAPGGVDDDEFEDAVQDYADLQKLAPPSNLQPPGAPLI